LVQHTQPRPRRTSGREGRADRREGQAGATEGILPQRRRHGSAEGGAGECGEDAGEGGG